MLIIGHRGCNLEPENTLRALAKGMECADFVEVDVRMSKDGVPMIMHDRTLERTTNGKGMVKDFTLEQLKELDAGKGEKIPTLREVLDLVRDRGLLVEIKEAGSEEKICDTIKESGVRNLILVSFNPGSLRNAKEMLPDIKTGIIYSRVVENPLQLALGIKANILLPKYELASRELVERSHRGNLMVFPWTLNTDHEIRNAVDLEVDGFATDNPCFVRQLLSI